MTKARARLSSRKGRALALPLKLAACLLLAILAVSCGSRNRQPEDPHRPRPITGRFLWENNSENIKKIKPGMTREEVDSTMGLFRVREHSGYDDSPARIDPVQKDGDSYEILYYELRRRGSPTPIILKNNAVTGWGWQSLRDAFPPSMP
jgi:hypothetical protein